jgi:predicted RNA-binding protein with PUA-like domain
MKHWLVKTEPSTWSWADQVRDGTTFWHGVRNYQASNNLKAMALGDQAFFYHSVEEKQIVGIVEVVKLYYPDHTDESGRFGMVDFKAVKPLVKPVTLATIKSDPAINHLLLVRHSRLSVMPIDDEAWNYICKLGGI